MLVFLYILTAGCRERRSNSTPSASSAPPAEWFEDVTEKSRLHFTHDAGPTGTYFFPQIMGSGCALFDFDNDGRLDVYLVNNGGPTGRPNQLFRREPDGTFTDVSAGSGLDVSGWGMGVAVGDVNNDGLPDVLLTEVGRVRLFLNRGNGHFEDVTRSAGLDDPQWATSAAFVDYDRDGKLDLVVTNYVAYQGERTCADAAGRRDYCGPRDFEGTGTRLFHNEGNDAGGVPHFADLTARSGLGAEPAKGLGVLCADFDGDGWPDVFVANDGEPNQLWINRHDGTFGNEADRRGVALNAAGQRQGNMGVAAGDFFGAGRADLLVTHLTGEPTVLWRQFAPGVFQDATAEAGLADGPGQGTLGQGTLGRGTGFGVVMADFRNSGTLDVAIANGRVVRRETDAGSSDESLPLYWRAYAERNVLLENRSGRFSDVSASNPSFCGTSNVARGLACGDVFNDGSTCLLVTTVAGPARLLRSVASAGGHWLTIRAVDPALGGRDAYGAKVTLKLAGRTLVGWVNPGSSYLSSNDPRVHFGLGSATRLERIEIAWPDGRTDTYPGPPVDRVVNFARGR